MRHLDPRTRRVLLSHTVGALALSLPWPLLLVLVDQRSNDPVLLGLAGSARMLPFVLCSWLGGRLADACRRDLIVRATLVARGILMLLGALALLGDHVWLAVASATLAVAVATPAYPALVAAMPGVAGQQRRAATRTREQLGKPSRSEGRPPGQHLILGRSEASRCSRTSAALAVAHTSAVLLPVGAMVERLN